MKKIILLFLFGYFHHLSITAQVNYALNGGFEQYSACPTHSDHIRFANYWQPIDTAILRPLCAPDFCHTCAGANVDIGIPHANTYTHYPHTGSGMMQNIFYLNNSSISGYERNYTQGKLRTHLIVGNNYCVTFYVTLAQASVYAVNGIGAYLDDGTRDAGQESMGCSSPQTSFLPQVFTNTVINDTMNWVKIQGSFAANGSERFITIGNFFSDANTDTFLRKPASINNSSVYLIDDVSVIASDAVADAGPGGLVGLGDSVHIGTYEEGMPCTWYVLGNPTPIGYGGGIWVHPTVTTTYVVALDLCSGITYDTVTKYVCPAGVSALSFPGELISFYPNPATTELHIDHIAGCRVMIYDIAGKAMLSERAATDKAAINISSLPQGIYMVHITDPGTGNKVVRRLVKE